MKPFNMLSTISLLSISRKFQGTTVLSEYLSQSFPMHIFLALGYVFPDYYSWYKAGGSLKN